MSTMYCWTDWDDNTTSVHAMSIIQEPRKPWNEYCPGEGIVAKLPKFGIWNGTIVEISDSKKDLEKSMNERQKSQAENMAELNGANNSLSTNVDVVEESSQKEGRQKRKQSNDQNEKEKEKKKKVKSVEKKGIEKDIASEKQKKKEEKAAKLDASNRQVEEMLLLRRKTTTATHDEDEPLENETVIQQKMVASSPMIPLSTPPFQNPGNPGSSSAFNPVSVCSSRGHDPEPLENSSEPMPGTSRQSPTWPSYYANNYSYLREMYSPQNSYYTLTSRSEVEDQNRHLKEENEQLKIENDFLRSELEKSSGNKDVFPDICVTPRKVQFIKKLACSLETKLNTTRLEGMRSETETTSNELSSSQSSQIITPISNKPKVLKPKPVRLVFNEQTAEIVDSDPKDAHADDSSLDAQEQWEKPVTSSGLRKIKLVNEYDVWITPSQLSLATLKANGDPRKMLISLLDTFFSREVLAESSAKGARVAHNKHSKVSAQPLNPNVLCALKEYILKVFKKGSGEPCITDKSFNEAINNKCGTARRSLNLK